MATVWLIDIGPVTLIASVCAPAPAGAACTGALRVPGGGAPAAAPVPNDGRGGVVTGEFPPGALGPA